MLASHQRLTVRTKLLLLLLILCSAVGAYIAHVDRETVWNVDSSRAVTNDVESASAEPSSDPPREMLANSASAGALQVGSRSARSAAALRATSAIDNSWWARGRTTIRASGR